MKRVVECIQAGKHHTLDPIIDEGKWFAAKIIKENFGLQQNNNVVSLLDIPSKGWRDFPSYNIPQLFNYGHIHIMSWNQSAMSMRAKTTTKGSDI